MPAKRKAECCPREGPETARAAHLFEEMHRLRRVWSGMQAGPPRPGSDFAFLNVIHHAAQEGGAVTTGRLAKRMGQSMPAVSQKVGELERGGLVRREVSMADRRRVQIELTPEGEAVVLRSRANFLSRITKTLDAMGPEEADKLISSLASLIKAAEEVRAAETEPPPPGG